jgi:glucose-6-phosphate isomerase
MTSTNRSLRSFPAWKALEAHFSTVHELHLRQLFAEDPKRGERFALEAAAFTSITQKIASREKR